MCSDGIGTKWVVRNYGTSITADRYLNKIDAQDKAIELQCVGYHIEDLKNKDFIEQFPLVENIEELEEDQEKLLEIGKALGQFDENGNPILYLEDIEGLEFEEDQIVITRRKKLQTKKI